MSLPKSIGYAFMVMNMKPMLVYVDFMHY